MAYGEWVALEDVSPAEWIAPRLTGAIGTVTGTVPSGYPAYVRICHPVELATWSAVAAFTGRRAHPLMQWHALVGSADPYNATDSLWPGANPWQGGLVPAALGPLCDVLAEHTATPESCYFGLWVGFGWVREMFAADVEKGPLTHHPLGRDYALVAGPLATALRVGGDRTPPESPSLFWPADHAWFVATEVDFDSTLVGGTVALVEALLQTPELDAWLVGPEDSLRYDADRINAIPER